MEKNEINKKQLGEYIFNIIKKDIKEKGFNLKKFPPNYFLSNRTVYNIKHGIFSFKLLEKVETKFNFETKFSIRKKKHPLIEDMEKFEEVAKNILKNFEEEGNYEKEHLKDLKKQVSNVIIKTEEFLKKKAKTENK